MVKVTEIGVLAQEGGHGGDIETKHQAGNTRNTGDEVDVGDFGASVEKLPESQRWFDHAVFVRRETHFVFVKLKKEEGGGRNGPVFIVDSSPPGSKNDNGDRVTAAKMPKLQKRDITPGVSGKDAQKDAFCMEKIKIGFCDLIGSIGFWICCF